MTVTIPPAAREQSVIDFELPSRARWRRTRRNVVAVFGAVALAAGAVAMLAWLITPVGGARLLGGPCCISGPSPVGSTFRVGGDLTTDGGEVELLDARPINATPGADVLVAIVGVSAGEQIQGSLTDVSLRGVFGVRLKGRGPNPRVTMALEMTASRPGIYRVPAIEVTYRSGGATRHARLEADVCMQAYVGPVPAHSCE